MDNGIYPYQYQVPAGNGEMVPGRKVTENIYLCPDGKLRWVYELNMLKNPTILITVWKVLGLSFGIVFVFVLLINVFGGNFSDASDFLGFVRGFFFILLFLLALGVVGYLIVAASYGWNYMVLFTMDEDSVEHRQMKKQFDKAKALGWLGAAAGLAAGSLGAAGAGILGATRDTSTSLFANVREVKASRMRNVIYVNQLLSHNQVYAGPEDFDFVANYIAGHCPNAKIR